MSEQTAPGSVPGASARPGDVVDLDALRAQRLETAPERSVVFGGKRRALVAEVPFEYAEVYRSGRRVEATRLLFVDDGDADDFFAMRPSHEDVAELVAIYNVSPGKSSAS
ncbi:MAG: hypothetical protein K1X95_17120 [Acidimicrobiia bacterium]|nr:hypothetical protein [Acidimicrobiia bacterium]